MQTDDDVLIGGLTIDAGANSNGCASILLRAMGPSLAQYGISNALQDPTLALYDSNGTLIGFNNDWEIGNQSTEIQASGFAPSGSKESAINVILGNGKYTAVVQGANRTRGQALLEAYQLP